MTALAERTYEELYLSYVNEFLTVERFAEYYSMEQELAVKIIDKGREINHSRAK